jgi:protein AroM
MKTRIGFLTIGQSPRDDVVPQITQGFAQKIRVYEKGALDGLARSEILALAPDEGDAPLLTRLRSGSTVVVGKRKITPLLKKQIRWFLDQDVRLIALLCTEEFPRLRPPGVVIQASRALLQAVLSGSRKGRLGVFVPLESQKEAAERKWRKTEYEIIVEALNPYQKFAAQGKALERMRDEDPSAVTLDCLGFTPRMAIKIRDILHKPVFDPRGALAVAIEKLI